MYIQIQEAMGIAISLLTTVVLLTICSLYTEKAQLLRFKEGDIKAFTAEIKAELAWRQYEGSVTGADVVDFVVRHKDVCDIVIHDARLSANSSISRYLINGSLIMGLADQGKIPNEFWDVTFLYDNIISGDGEGEYTATLLYDGQLSPEFVVDGEQVRGNVITGIEYRAFSPCP